MTATLLSAVEVDPRSAPAASVIWLHGLGADGHDFAGIPRELALAEELAVRYVFPHAPKIPVTINQGFVMPAWYDIRSLDNRNEDEAGIRRSQAQVERLVEREIELGVPPERIVLAGFSQGAAISLVTGLRHAERLAGILALSGYLLLADELEREASPANRDVPIFQAHGTQDPMVPFGHARASCDRLRELGWEVEWHEYPMAHQVCLEEIEAISRWLTRVLRGT